MIRMFFYNLLAFVLKTASTAYGLFLGNYLFGGNIFPSISKKQLIKNTVLFVFWGLIATFILVFLETP